MPVIGTAIGGLLGALVGGGLGYGIGTMADKSAVEGRGTPGRAAGGPVKANTSYLVGEKGPELFVPNGAGNIINNKDLQQNAGMSGMPNMPDMTAEYKKIESGILGASKNSQMLADQTPEYKKIDLAVKDIVADIQSMAKYDDLRSTTTKTFTEKYTDYTKSMSDLLDQDLTNTTRFMEAGGTSAVSSAMSGGSSGGQGMRPVSSGAPGMSSGGSLEGLKMKKGDVQAADAGVHPKLIEMAKQVQANMPNFAYFSAFNDQYHQENAPSSFHTKGLAMDFALNKAPTKEEGQAIVKYLQSIGASTAIDEYNNPSSKATAGHIHAQIPGFADGGIALEPTIAMVAEKGPEVMMPLTNDGFLGQLNTGINSLLPQQQRMVSLLEDISRSQATMATATQIMASVASN
jgi:SLT domain-containing protein